MSSDGGPAVKSMLTISPTAPASAPSDWRSKEIADAQGDVDAFVGQYDQRTRKVPQIAAQITQRLLAVGRAEEHGGRSKRPSTAKMAGLILTGWMPGSMCSNPPSRRYRHRKRCGIEGRPLWTAVAEIPSRLAGLAAVGKSKRKRTPCGQLTGF
jgi:hypothetical protein